MVCCFPGCLEPTETHLRLLLSCTVAAREMTNEAWSNDALTNAAAAAGQCVGSEGQRLGNMDMWSCINGENMTIEDKDESETLMRMLEKEEELKSLGQYIVFICVALHLHAG